MDELKKLIAQIEALKSPEGGYTKEVLMSLGVPWPPPKGWKRKLIKQAKAMKRERKIFTSLERKAVLESHGSTCYLCQRPIDLKALWHIDHVVPFSKGGDDDMANLRPTHKVCNELKGTTDIRSVQFAAAWNKRAGAQ